MYDILSSTLPPVLSAIFERLAEGNPVDPVDDPGPPDAFQYQLT
ncbi:hypothetical protein QFZ27_001754 [Inquilinus ginsengisoli]